MSFDEKTDRMDWKDEASWMAIASISGIILWLIFLYYERFPDNNQLTILFLSVASFYLLSILVRIQNHRGKLWTGKTGWPEKKLKWVFPIMGFLVGLALLI